MNAYELAQELHEDLQWIVTLNTDLKGRLALTINMLRQQADRIAELEKYATNGNEILVDCDTHMDKLQKLVLEKDKELKRYKMAWNMAENQIAELEKENSNLKYEVSSDAWQPKEATDQELFNIYAHLQDTYEGDNFPVALGRKILKLYTTPQTKPLSDEEISEIWEGLFENEDDIVHIHNFARAIEERHGIK